MNKPEPELGSPSAVSLRKPPWLRVKPPSTPEVAATRRLMRRLALNTVCEEAACPNIGECWQQKHATVMILGDVCTRACAFCNIKTGLPRPADASEPEHVAQACAELGLSHIVITSVDRDDLADGGADQFVRVIAALRRVVPDTTIEILTPDFRNKPDDALARVAAAGPDVFNHNLETVPRLYLQARPGADYVWSLQLLRRFKQLHPGIPTKSGLMLGLGETLEEIEAVMRDLRAHDCDMLTLGQYLQPSKFHLPVARFVPPEEFDHLAERARALGFTSVASGPMVRSSYHADRQAAGETIT